jgi:RES domain-containing protein
MRAYRIGSGGHPVFDGTGASLYGGRWNDPRQRVVYCSASFAIAMLERLCYAALGRLPDGDRYVEVDVPDDSIEIFDETAHPGWDASGSTAVARIFGSRWWQERRSVALLVPSVVTKIDRNLVLNQDHPDFGRLGTGPERPVHWDRRLFLR